MLTLAGAMPDPEMEATLGRLPLLGELTALALRAGPMRGLLRHLQLPPGVKAGFPPDPGSSSCRIPSILFLSPMQWLMQALPLHVCHHKRSLH